MKKLLVLLLVLSFPAFGMSTDSVRSYVYCIDGYKYLYVFTSNDSSAGITVVQMFERFNNFANPPAATKCDGNEPYQVDGKKHK